MFHDWENFYLLIGSAAAALIGLLFVVATLTAGREHSSVSRGATVYMTPTVFHFALVLLISALALVPEARESVAGPIVLVCGLTGLGYAISVGVRLRSRRTPADTHWSDFWFYGVAPAVVYLGMANAAVAIWADPPDAPYGIAFILLALLFVGIRNAWDLVTWLAPRRPAS